MSAASSAQPQGVGARSSHGPHMNGSARGFLSVHKRLDRCPFRERWPAILRLPATPHHGPVIGGGVIRGGAILGFVIGGGTMRGGAIGGGLIVVPVGATRNQTPCAPRPLTWTGLVSVAK